MAAPPQLELVAITEAYDELDEKANAGGRVYSGCVASGSKCRMIVADLTCFSILLTQYSVFPIATPRDSASLSPTTSAHLLRRARDVV